MYLSTYLLYVGPVASGDTYHLPTTTYHLHIYLSTYLHVSTYLLYVGPVTSGDTYYLPPTTYLYLVTID
jgi:hypothetical protein